MVLLKNAVIFDMDGTLADCAHRLHYVNGPSRKNWESFFAEAKKDPPRKEILQLASELSANNAILIASGRPEHLRKVTESWLLQHGLKPSRIYLRKEHDRRPDGAVKAEMLERMREHGYQPWLVIDDRQSAVDAWRKLGLVCLQCDESRY